ncbi:MAG: antibiotic biosynthesis monooxygenase [Pseudomonadota bacterium]
MFVAMNRFRVAKGKEDQFEEVWRSRETRLEEMAGFKTFHLLRGGEADDYTLYASHTIWSDRASFEAWTRSEQFRDAHKDAGQNRDLYLGHPEFEGFESVLGA